jgi:hypothetical protein
MDIQDLKVVKFLFLEAEMDVDMPMFEPSKFELTFPFFDSGISDYLKHSKEDALVGREMQIRKVNRIIDRREIYDKYQPIICTTSRGMGKTAFMTAIGMQMVKSELKNKLILDAIHSGRVLSFDFAKAVAENPIALQEDIRSFFTRLMIYFLCRMFDGTQVGGIHFEKISRFGDVGLYTGRQRAFRVWCKMCLLFSADDMMDEYIRLTNIAFGVECDAPPVFLLDEIQSLCKPTSIQSKLRNDDNGIVCHSFLSLLLTQLAGRYNPVCICTGTNSGGIFTITDEASIIPQFISLTTLHKNAECTQYWLQRTHYLNSKSLENAQIEDQDEDMINALIYASYQIPRLMLVAHQAWFEYKTKPHLMDRMTHLQVYEDKAIFYYGEMAELLSNPNFKAEDIAHIMMCCGVQWKIHNIDDNVPGTKIPWNNLIRSSIIFPYSDCCYLLPFHLVWGANNPSSRGMGDNGRTRAEIKEICHRLIPNLDVTDLYVSYDSLRQLSLYKLGICYETLFVSSLATKYYLRSVTMKKKSISFSNLYDLREDPTYSNLFSDLSVDFSQGISLLEREMFVNSKDYPTSVIHNRNIHNPHHDIILPGKMSETRDVLIGVSCKASFGLSDRSARESQQKISKETKQKEGFLLWLSLGVEKPEADFQGTVAFMNGAGCCNGLALDMILLVKKFISQNNKSQ